MKPIAQFAAGIALVAVAGAAGFFAYWLSRPSNAPIVVSEPITLDDEPGVPGDALPGKAPPRRVIPERLPDFTLQDEKGQPRKLSEWSGRPLLVNFWATWCAPCRREIPLLISLRREYKPMGLEVIGIAVDFRDAVLQYAADIGIDYPLLIGEQDGLAAVDAFGMDMVFPFSVFADSQGRIVALKVGELHHNEAEFILERIKALDAGQLELPAAQQQISDRLRELAIERARNHVHADEESEDEH